MYNTKNFQKTAYFQSFHNLKIRKLVKAIDLSPIIALGPEYKISENALHQTKRRLINHNIFRVFTI